MKHAEFSKVFAQLNPAQKKAVETIEGPVMVIAGPGTGKTHVLAARIAQILKKTDTPPYAILALTFTDSAAVNIRKRVVNMIGKAGYYVNISTFHAFCSDVIKTHPEYFPIDRGSEPLNDLERYDFFQNIIEASKLDILKPINRPLFYIQDIIHAISNLKREGVTPAEFLKIVKREFERQETKLTKIEEALREKNKKKNTELANIYSEYEKKLRSHIRYDFDDMIALVVEAFKKNTLLLREYQEKLLYFLVDEYQDTNSSQNTVIELLAHYWGVKANLFVVGDPNQSIFRFQGASIENTLSFVKRFPHAEIITLEKGYRSPQLIYDAAYSLIQYNTLTTENEHKTLMKAVNKKLITIHSKGGKISIAALPSQTLELVYVVETIKQLIQKGTKLEEIAVLYRNNSDANEIQEMLDKWSVPYEISGGANILEAETIRQLLQLFRVIRDIRQGTESGELYEVLSYEWIDVSKMLTMKIGRAAGRARLSIYNLITQGYEIFKKNYCGNDVSKIEFHTAEKFIANLEKWNTDDANMIFTAWFEMMLKESGYLDWILKQETKIELLTNLNSLFREVKALVRDNHELKLEQFIHAVETMRDHRIQIQAEDLNIEKGSIHLSTVHRAKGREWEYVFIIHCIDGKWGNARIRELIPLPRGLLKNTDISKKEKNEDERRLFYVAITRAKKSVCISYPETIISDHTSRDVSGSMFIEEIGEKNFIIKDIRNLTEEADKHLENILRPRETPLINITDQDFFRKLIENFKLSVTAMNTYLRDKDEFIENVLLRVPRAKPEPMAFGTAIHKALERLYKVKMENGDLRLESLLKVFEISLEKELLYSTDLERRLKYGKEVLKRYYEEHTSDRVEPLFVERFFGYGFSKTVLDNIPLTGRIDRIDWVDKGKKQARVVDYKTGRAKTIHDIEGKTISSQLSKREQNLPESIRGPYKRQLLFYKLLTQLDQTFVPIVTEGVFDFVEAHKETGKLIKRKFELKDEEVSELKNLIREVMKEIRELKFLH
ncbi:hypothetical protein A3G65_04595 [Candidatus Roizmanbacteria bacterium RIFCSPLOWO2_12_FULL_37_7b]|nr:MAG: hypothetical protein A3G65_04595 [Candidatus Roizmanbacteria bacterium RIFCSPLOWO2_12_FULL_37_7b]